jgi:hypothetical protein
MSASRAWGGGGRCPRWAQSRRSYPSAHLWPLCPEIRTSPGRTWRSERGRTRRLQRSPFPPRCSPQAAPSDGLRAIRKLGPDPSALRNRLIAAVSSRVRPYPVAAWVGSVCACRTHRRVGCLSVPSPGPVHNVKSITTLMSSGRRTSASRREISLAGPCRPWRGHRRRRRRAP